MGNVVNSINKQIEKLEKRGLDLSCYELPKIKELLLDIGYFRLGFYCFYFFDEKERKFDEGIKISDIINLYYLDIDLKFLLLRYINRIEINFRTKLIYYVSMKYKNDSRWFVDPAIMSEDSVTEFKERIYTTKFIQDNMALKKHHLKYPADEVAPCWKVFEYLTFGSTVALFGSIQDTSVKQIIADKYGVKDLNKFFKLIHTVRQVRNICAHSGVLFDYSLPQSVSSIPQITYNKDDRNSLDAIIKVIGFFLQSISVNRYNDFQVEIETLFAKHLEDPVLATMIRERIKYLD